MVLDRNLIWFKIASVFVALLMAAFILMRSYVQAEAIVFESLGAAVAAFGGLSGLGLAAIAVVLVAMAVLGYSTSKIDLGGFSPDQIVRITDKAIKTIGVAQMTSLVNAIVAGELVLTVAIMPAWDALIAFIQQTLVIPVVAGTGLSFADSGIRSVHCNDLADSSLISGSSWVETVPLDTVRSHGYDFSAATAALIAAAATAGAAGALYVYAVFPETNGNIRCMGVRCIEMTSAFGAVVDASTPLYAFYFGLFQAKPSKPGYSMLSHGGLMDYATAMDGIATGISTTSPYYLAEQLQACIDFWLSNAISFSMSTVHIFDNAITLLTRSVSGSDGPLDIRFGPFAYWVSLAAGSLRSLVTQTVAGFDKGVPYDNSYYTFGLDYLIGGSFFYSGILAWYAGIVSLIFTGLTQREVAGEVQVGNVATGVEVGGSVAIPLPDVDNPDIAIPIPDIGVLAPDIAASLPDIAAEIAQPFIDVFVPIGDVIYNLPDIIGDFISPAADSVAGLADAAEDAFGIFKFWYDWRAS